MKLPPNLIIQWELRWGNWVNTKGWKGANVAITELLWMLVWHHSDLFWIAHTWESVMKICSFTTMKTSFSLQAVVSVYFSLSSSNPWHLQQQRRLLSHMETQCRLAVTGAAGTSWGASPGADVPGQHLLFENETLLFFVLFSGWIKRFHKLEVLECLGSCSH